MCQTHTIKLMDKNSTNFLNTFSNSNAMVEGLVITEYADADELIFHHSIRAELDTLQLKPSPQTIEKLLNYSKSLR
jgi:hypothetical protein